MRVRNIVLFLFIIIPALEIALLVLSGNVLGIWPTFTLIVATGVIGAALAKRQGWRTLERAKREWMSGEIPGDALLDGVCILIGAILLLTPGFITDIVGFLLLFPVTRKRIKPVLTRFFKWYFYTRTWVYIRK
ncbi:FxsA family protein [Thermolongibacillus altinsuensis]|uniref:FxsA family protein n=1 Tax=Thermolongibacillus altinsuensis TaxID=575256 RepID=UPI0027956B3C|nr:FxsA family protein [Thermolongibacillus altinsuensis]